jgi:altronate dehydratase
VQSEIFRRELLAGQVPRATLAYGEPAREAGLHFMDTETRHWTENLTGLGGGGAQLFVAFANDHARQGHPLIPVIQVAETQSDTARSGETDLVLPAESNTAFAELVRLIAEVAARRLTPRAVTQRFHDFQITRGLLGVTT